MSVSGENRFFKLASSVKKMVNTKKKPEENFSNSDIDTSSIGSNESETSEQVSTTKQQLTPDAQRKKSAKDSKPKLSKSLRKKFFRHFSNVEEGEQVLNRYYCALLGDILLQGSIYITNNYFAFYSNVFGYVTKILIPIVTVTDITKEKVAKIVPNAIGIATREQKHVFGSFLSRDSTMEQMKHIWQEVIRDNSQINEKEADSSEFGEEESDKDSPQDDNIHEQDDNIHEEPKESKILVKAVSHLENISRHRVILLSTTALLILLYISATIMLYRINQVHNKWYNIALDDFATPGSKAYSELLHRQTELHSKSQNAVYGYLDENLNQIAKVKESLEELSSLLVETSNPVTEEVDRDPHRTADSYS